MESSSSPEEGSECGDDALDTWNTFGLVPNNHIIHAVISSIESSNHLASGDESSSISRSELDLHANMVVLGWNAFIFESSGRTCNVRPFSDELGIAKDVPIVDGAIAVDCHTTGETKLLMVRNALYLPSLVHNLIPLFIMRAGGVTVNDVPCIHCAEPTDDDHCILFSNSDFCKNSSSGWHILIFQLEIAYIR